MQLGDAATAEVDITDEELEAVLHAHGVPVEYYGTQGAKRVADLLDELDCGSSRLEQTGTGLIRATRGRAARWAAD